MSKVSGSGELFLPHREPTAAAPKRALVDGRRRRIIYSIFLRVAYRHRCVSHCLGLRPRRPSRGEMGSVTAAGRPAVDSRPETAEFLEGLARGELLLPHCICCGRVGHPGERRCVRCMAGSFEWIAASGRATVFSYIVIGRSFHPSFEAPYAVTVFELEEGPRIIGELLGVPPGAIEVGLDVVADRNPPAPGEAPLRFRPVDVSVR